LEDGRWRAHREIDRLMRDDWRRAHREEWEKPAHAWRVLIRIYEMGKGGGIWRVMRNSSR